jgi:hypothetical protein
MAAKWNIKTNMEGLPKKNQYYSACKHRGNRSGTVNADTTDFPAHRYVMIRINGKSKGREHGLLQLKALLNFLTSDSHISQLDDQSHEIQLERNKIPSIPTYTTSPFEQRNRRYYLSSSPNWYHSAISPSNPLYYLSPLESTNSTPSFNKLSEAITSVRETTRKFPLLLENDEEETPAKDGGDLLLLG